MSGLEEHLLRTLRATFKVEAAEHLQAIGAGLLELERTAVPAQQMPLIEKIFRAAHSLKGAARAVNFGEIESLCQSLEGLFAAWKRRESAPDADRLDHAHRALDSMSEAIAAAASGAGSEAQRTAAKAACSAEPEPHGVTPSVQPTAAQRSPSVPAAEAETVRIAVSSLDARLLEAEEMLTAKLAAGQWAVELAALEARFQQWRKQWSRVQPQLRTLKRRGGGTREVAAIADSHELAEFFDWNYDYWRGLEGSVTGLRRAAEQNHLLVARLVDELLENSKQLLMLPVSTLSALLFKVVRDLCRDQGKEAALTICGEEVTIDKRILEELKDPLLHLLRNCVDHGVETPEQRRRAGKPSQATITVAVAAVSGDQVEISVSDDGAGVDLEKVKLAAGRHGLRVPDAPGSHADSAALGLVFEADVSTSPIITQVSGRGLGLAIVREKAEKLGGRVAIDSQRGAGTVIRMMVPVTQATFRGVLVRTAQRLFVVPTAHVARVIRFKPAEVQTVEGRRTLAPNGRAVALVDLAEVLQLPAAHGRAGDAAAGIALLLNGADQTMAFAVNEVLDEREILVKRFSKPLSRVRNIAGATILGSGEVAPILNVLDLIKSARNAGAMRVAPDLPPPESAAKRILVAEDSITSRMLVKGMLESAGYAVSTAVDGVDAFTTLRAGHFDLIVSDVEMPRLDGFDLTLKIRADKVLAEIPVVLVTALESREDRERGIEVGANAYLVKSSLDQDDLLEAVHRLI